MAEDASRRYLMITASGELSDFRIQMLAHQQINALLPCTIRRVNGMLRIAYDVGGRRSLQRFCEAESIGFEMLSNLFRTIGSAYREMYEYLLDADMLLLSPAYIYFEQSKKTFFFCCVPCGAECREDSFHELCAFLLKHLDDTDDKAVQLCYRMYKGSGSSGFCPAEELQRLSQTEALREEEPLWKQAAVQILPDREQQDESVSEQAAERTVAPHKEKEKRKKPKVEKARSERIKPEKFKWPWVKEMTAQPRPLPAYAGEKLFAYGGKGCVLHGKTKGLPMFTPAAFPFLVGSLEFAVDGYIGDVTVSRFHAQLEKKEDGYYVKDLDSTHGTYVNGERIIPQTAVPVSDGDEIRFGKAAFAFSV